MLPSFQRYKPSTTTGLLRHTQRRRCIHWTYNIRRRTRHPTRCRPRNPSCIHRPCTAAVSRMVLIKMCIPWQLHWRLLFLLLWRKPQLALWKWSPGLGRRRARKLANRLFAWVPAVRCRRNVGTTITKGAASTVELVHGTDKARSNGGSIIKISLGAATAADEKESDSAED